MDVARVEHGERHTVEIGARLRAARRAAGLKQSDVAGGQVTASAISRYESGARRPDEKTLVFLAQRLDTTPEALMAGPLPQRRPAMELKLSYAGLALAGGETHNAQGLAQHVVKTTHGTADQDLADQATLILARVMEADGDADGAILELEDLRARVSGGPLLAAIGIALSRCYRETGSLDLAVSAGEEVLASLQQQKLQGLDDYMKLTVTVAAAYFEKGDTSQAIRLCRRALGAAEVHGSMEGRAAAHWEASILERTQGNIQEAIRLATKALAILETGDSTRNLGRLRIQLGFYELAKPDADIEAARSVFELARREMDWSSASPIDVARTLMGLAKVHFASGMTELALGALDEIPFEAEDQSPFLAAEKLVLRGHIYLAAGREAEASSTLDQAGDVLVMLDRDRGAAQLWFEVGETRQRLGQVDAALHAFRSASMSLGAELPISPPGLETFVFTRR